MPRPSPHSWAPKRLAPLSRLQRRSSFPQPTRSHAHRCSCLTRQDGDEQSGLVTLTFDILTLKVMSESCVTWATSVPILFFLGLSVLDLGPMYATDVKRQTRIIAYCPLPVGRGHNNLQINVSLLDLLRKKIVFIKKKNKLTLGLVKSKARWV